MKTAIKNTAVIILAAAITACCPCRFARKYAKPFEGTTWHLVQLTGRDVHFDPDTFNITFADGQLHGKGSCNNFAATYTSTDKEALSISKIASTRAFCPESKTEQQLFTELDDATHYEITGSMLFLLKNGEIRAIFSAPDDESSDTKSKKRLTK